MSERSAAACIAEQTKRQPRRAKSDRSKKRRRQPRYHVILWDDDDHSYQYVVHMMQELFGFQVPRGYEIARVVDVSGRAICLTTTLEHAELKRDQIHAYGGDRRIKRCMGSMSASIEPVP